MQKPSLKPLLLTLAIGFSGAGAATLAGLPAAPLVGASIAVSIAALFGLAANIPVQLRNIAFTIIGCSLGSGITKEALAQSAQWPISLMILGVAVCVIMIAGSWVLSRFYRLSPETAVLSTAPGAFAYTMALAAGGIGDIRSIMVIQNIRLVLVTTLLPFILHYFGFETGHFTAQASGGFGESIVIILIALVGGISVKRWRIPASFLLIGMLVSGVGHYLGLVTGRPPFPLIFFGFAVTGSMVGARFSAIPRRDLKRLLSASLVSALITGLLAVAFAYPAALLLDLSFGQVFVSFAPGGVEAMAAMAIALGYDPAFVATHHLFRIILLFLLIPLSIKIVRKTVKKSEQVPL
jgi:membrane AbrB-like protein